MRMQAAQSPPIPRVHLLASIVAVSILSSAVPAVSQATGGGQIIHTDARFFERRAGGVLDACELTYAVGYDDFIYRNGNLVFVRGSLSMQALEPPAPPLFVVKVAAFDVADGQVFLAPMDYAYLSINGRSFAGEEAARFRCEDGGVCLAYQLSSHPELAVAPISGFSVAYNRKPRATDVAIPVNILQAAPQAAFDYSDCVDRLLDDLLRRADDQVTGG